MVIRSAALLLAVLLSFLVGSVAVADPTVVPFRLNPARGADPSVDYGRLLEHGPWHDENYRLTASDLQFLPPSDKKLHEPIPAFFRIGLRRAQPRLRGDITHYPRSALNAYNLIHKGYAIDGVTYDGVRLREDGRFDILKPGDDGVPAHGLEKLAGEVRITSPVGAAESAIAINPIDPDKVIAGSNGPGSGQIMWRSSDGGDTWTRVDLPDATTCCDPTVGWSSNGAIAYTATLDACSLSGCSVKFYRSLNDGASWTRTATLTASGSDKEYIHVDTFPTSPFLDNVYIAWHDGNVQKFARSTNQGVSFNATLTLDDGAAPNNFRGIGSDITTDKAGNVYYFFPAFSHNSIRMLKSTNGGASFAPGLTVASTAAEFDFPIPSMETRKAFIYVAADADYSNGPFANSIYAAWTDATATENETVATANHARIQVAFSRDGGATWTTVTPHPTADANTVDRYNQWMKVGDNGLIHLIYYQTSNSVNRTGVDVFYTMSSDGGVTWIPEQRVTTRTSPNLPDNFEWGDYNGMDMVLQDHIAIFTDNRDETGGTAASEDVYGAGTFAQTGPDFALTLNPDTVAVCAPGALPANTVSVRSVLGFVTPVTLSAPTLPTGFTNAAFTPNPVTPADPAATSIFTLDATAGAAPGPHDIIVRGVAGATTHEATLVATVSTAVPAMPSLTSPADGATSVATSPVLSWAAVAQAVGYDLEVSTDPTFAAPPVYTVALGNVTSHTLPVSLAPNTQHYWRVRARNGCGNGPYASRTFTTAQEICFTGSVAIPDNNPTGISNDLSGVPGLLLDLDVSVDIPHTWVGDLIVSLTHVGQGAARVLIDRPGMPPSASGCSANDIDVTLDDEGTAPVEDACSTTPPAVGGRLTPNNTLSTFDGQDFSGTWRLTVSDLAGADLGTLDRWCLLPSLGAVQPPTDAQIVKTGPASYLSGSAISYTLTVTNNGPAAAGVVNITDVVPASITGVTASCAANGTATCGTNATAGNNVSFTGGSVAAGAGNSIVVTINGTISGSASGPIANTASVALGAGQTDSAPANNSSSVTTNPPPSTDVSIAKTGPASYIAGTAISYTLTVTNTGNDAPRLNITDVVPASITGVSASCAANGTATCGTNATSANTVSFTGASIDAGAGNSLVVTINGTVAPSTTGNIVNTGTVALTSGQVDTAPANNSSSATSVPPTSTDVAIAKTGPASYIAGTAISYTLTVTNAGPAAAVAVNIADTVPATITGVTASCAANGTATCGTNATAGNAVSFTGGTIASGAGNSIVVTINGTVAPSANANIVNTATATLAGGQTDSSTGNNTSSVTSTPPATTDVAIVKTGPANYTAGAAISYTVTVTNAGPANAPVVAIADAVPAAITGVSASCAVNGTATCGTNATAGNSVSFTGASINAGAGNSIVVTINGTVAAGTTGALANTATATLGGGQTDSSTGNNTSTTTAQPLPAADLAIAKTGPATYLPGAAISYTVTVTNAGPGNALTFSIADAVPAAITGVTASCAVTGTGACGTNATAGNNVSFTGAALNSGAGNSLVVTINGTVAAGTTAAIANTATVAIGGAQTDGNAANNSATSTATSAAIDLAVVKTGPATYTPGAAISYTITVTNAGPAAAAGFSLADVVPARINGVTATCAVNGTGNCGTNASAGNNVSFTGLGVAAGAGSSLVFTVNGTVLPSATGSIVNTATVTAGAGQTDSTAANNTSSATSTPGSAPVDLLFSNGYED